ncbi:TIR domain-containing protein [Chitinophaga sp. CC14]|uniref:TIR domain-containing protein n=1 Tax=Chitinophaga sp. CC14 TaxID=3029199 RepID=UPI003B761AC9
MGRKIFVSYKYGDTYVKDLGIYEDGLWGKVKVATKARHYVDRLSDILTEEEHIYKGEDDGQSLADFSDMYIASALRDKIYDSSITIVFVSKGMKNFLEAESDQWMPWEISYSLRESSRGGRTSGSNGIIAIVLPDELDSYGYYITYSSECNCRMLNTGFLFKILRDNMFNEKSPTTSACVNGTIVYHGDNCYIQTVTWHDFISNPNKYLDKAIEIRDKIDKYNIVKNLD